MITQRRARPILMFGAAVLGLASTGHAKPEPEPFKIARIYIEYNASANDLGYHVTLDAEDWHKLQIVNPLGKQIFDVKGSGPYRDLGMTELFFEGAEPSLDEVPLAELLAMFPQGEYEFFAATVGKPKLYSVATLTHAIPDGPEVFADVAGDEVTIRWNPVTSPPPGFPDLPLDVVRYQVIVESFQVTLPGTSTEVTVPVEYIESLGAGAVPFEVLAIEAGGNQTLTEGMFELE